MMNLLQRIKSLFKIARLLSSVNTGKFLQGQFGYMGTNARGQIFIPYGTIGRPPDGSQIALFAQNGNESNAIGFASDPKNRVKPNAAPGEHGIANYVSGSYLFFPNNGDMLGEIQNNALFNCTGTFKIVIGNTVFEFSEDGLTVTGDDPDVIVDGINLKLHIHSQGNDGNGDSEVDTNGPVNP